jgi:transcriptional regulator with XRE-family HTH domain
MPRARRETDAQYLRRVMETMGWSQVDAAEVLGVTQPTISWRLNGKAKLLPLERTMLAQALAQREAVRLLQTSVNGNVACAVRAGARDVAVWLEHLPTCPACLAVVAMPLGFAIPELAAAAS